MLVIFLPSKLSVASYCTFLKCSCLLILGIPVTRFKQGRKTTNLNKCVTAHANLLVYHVVSVSSLALGWYEANKYLLLSLLAPVTLGTASPFCDFGMLIMFGELNFLYSNPCSQLILIAAVCRSCFLLLHSWINLSGSLDWQDKTENNENDMTLGLNFAQDPTVHLVQIFAAELHLLGIEFFTFFSTSVVLVQTALFLSNLHYLVYFT